VIRRIDACRSRQDGHAQLLCPAAADARRDARRAVDAIVGGIGAIRARLLVAACLPGELTLAEKSMQESRDPELTRNCSR
jgi:hypothetical protein